MPALVCSGLSGDMLMLEALITRLFAIGPLLFGIAFMAPVIATLMHLVGLSAPFGLSPLQLGLAIGIVWGLVASKRGTWI